MVFDILRVASCPMSTTEIAERVQKTKQVAEEHIKQLRNTVAQTIRHAEKAGQIELTGRDGLSKLWKIASQ